MMLPDEITTSAIIPKQTNMNDDNGTILGTTLIESDIKQKCQQITTVNPRFLFNAFAKRNSV